MRWGRKDIDIGKEKTVVINHEGKGRRHKEEQEHRKEVVQGMEKRDEDENLRRDKYVSCAVGRNGNSSSSMGRS